MSDDPIPAVGSAEDRESAAPAAEAFEFCPVCGLEGSPEEGEFVTAHDGRPDQRFPLHAACFDVIIGRIGLWVQGRKLIGVALSRGAVPGRMVS